jgi:hypothetical protein
MDPYLMSRCPRPIRDNMTRKRGHELESDQTFGEREISVSPIGPPLRRRLAGIGDKSRPDAKTARKLLVCHRRLFSPDSTIFIP